MIVEAIPALQDNYIWMMIDTNRRHAIVVDPGEAQPVLQHLAANSLAISAIFITHHHWDHTNGVSELQKKFKIPVYGPAMDCVTKKLGTTLDIPQFETIFEILRIPGHTLDHIAYYTPGYLFCGDTLFAGGCGRVFEGTHAQLFSSLQQLATLPASTAVYCAHEYTVNNLKFAQQVEPHNVLIDSKLNKMQKLRSAGLPTLPSTIADELNTNPFIRCHSLTEFIKLRQAKDKFR